MHLLDPPRRACSNLHRDLAKGAAGDCSRSGTTLCAAVLTGRKLTVANVGDSGCLRISRAKGIGLIENSAGGPDRVLVGRGEKGTRDAEMLDTDRGLGRRLTVARLSRDHKPEYRGELERIQAAGGTVFPLPDQHHGGGGGEGMVPPRHEELERARHTTLVRDFGADVPRVWKAGGSGPGLAMSRSIGDKVKREVPTWCGIYGNNPVHRISSNTLAYLWSGRASTCVNETFRRLAIRLYIYINSCLVDTAVGAVERSNWFELTKYAFWHLCPTRPSLGIEKLSQVTGICDRPFTVSVSTRDSL